MDIKKLREEIAGDEGKVLKSYLCSENKLTAGIGHLLPQGSMPVGTEITEQQCNDWFDEDIKTVLEDVSIVFPTFDEQPEQVQRCLANMCFQLGRTKLMKFKKLRQAINDKDYEEAAVQCQDSRWYLQTTNRATRIINRIRNEA
jgi:GH24 family phage-related lysozyme (muramidase)